MSRRELRVRAVCSVCREQVPEIKVVANHHDTAHNIHHEFTFEIGRHRFCIGNEAARFTVTIEDVERGFQFSAPGALASKP